MMTSILSLFCYVYGDGDNNVFQVKTDQKETVATLNDAIKEKDPAAFGVCGTKSLILWNVSIPCDENTNVKEEVENLNLDGAKPLHALKKLVNIFSGSPIEGHVHIIVKPPQSPSDGSFYYLINDLSDFHASSHLNDLFLSTLLLCVWRREQ